MNLPDPLPEPLLEHAGALTLTIAAFVTVDLALLAEVQGRPVNGAQAALIADEALCSVSLPGGMQVRSTLLQLAVHSPPAKDPT